MTTTSDLDARPCDKLDPREEHHRIASPRRGLSLFLRHLPPRTADSSRVVLYVHGGTFPSGLSIAHRFDGRSWRDELNDAGFDFHGFGLSDPYPEMALPANDAPPLGRAEDASRQLEATICFIRHRQGADRISIIAHSWGSIVCGRLVGRCPGLVHRLVFFGPITWRSRTADSHAPARLAVGLARGSMEPLHRNCTKGCRPRAAAPAFRRVGGALPRQRPGEPHPVTGRGQGAERCVLGHL